MQLELQRAELTSHPPRRRPSATSRPGAPALLAVTAQLSTQAQPCEMRMVTIILKLKSLMKWRVRGRPWLGGCRPFSSVFVNPCSVTDSVTSSCLSPRLVGSACIPAPRRACWELLGRAASLCAVRRGERAAPSPSLIPETCEAVECIAVQPCPPDSPLVVRTGGAAGIF